MYSLIKKNVSGNFACNLKKKNELSSAIEKSAMLEL